jgi:hypothetical protein
MMTGKAKPRGPTGGGGSGPIGGGGSGPIGGGDSSSKILKKIAKHYKKLSKLFDCLARVPLGGWVPSGGDITTVLPTKKPSSTTSTMGVDFNPQIDFVQEDQEGYELCWIAVAVSVKRHFESTSNMQQCGLAQALLVVNGPCCNNSGGVRKKCDKPGQLEFALAHPSVNHLVADTAAVPNPIGKGPMTFADIKGQIDDNLPVCIYIDWSGGGIGHFSVISGYYESAGGKYLYVNDPLYGSGPQPYNRVVSNYNLNGGTWKYTYRLKV